MLVFHRPQNDPPGFIQPYVALVTEHLLAPWRVRLTAYDDDDPKDLAFISAAVIATTPTGLHADVSRHAGSDVVQVRLHDSNPIPFEDLAVAKGWLDKEVLLAHAVGDDGNVGDALPSLVCALDLLHEWTSELPSDLGNPDFVAQLRTIADDFVAALPCGPAENRG